MSILPLPMALRISSILMFFNLMYLQSGRVRNNDFRSNENLLGTSKITIRIKRYAFAGVQIQVSGAQWSKEQQSRIIEKLGLTLLRTKRKENGISGACRVPDDGASSYSSTMAIRKKAAEIFIQKLTTGPGRAEVSA